MPAPAVTAERRRLNASPHLLRDLICGPKWSTRARLHSYQRAGSIEAVRPRGAGGVRARLVALGARPLPEMVREVRAFRGGPDPDEWLELALAQIGARRVRHRGCHRFAWPVGDRGWRRRCPIGLVELPYPLATDPAVPL